MPGADRAINMAVRARGIGEVERDFKRVGKAGEESFDQVKKAANGANQEVSEYTARLRRAADAAKRAFDRGIDRNPDFVEARLTNPTQFRRELPDARREFILGAVQTEKNAISEGLPETTEGLNTLWSASERTGASLARYSIWGAVAAAGLKLTYEAVQRSIEAYLEHEAAVARFEADLSLIGNRSEATGEQVRRMADDIVASTLQTTEASLEGARQLATVSDLTVTAFEEALAASAAYADTAGRELPDVLNSTTIPVLEALADRNMPDLFKATEGLNDELRVSILRLAEAGDTAGAQQALFEGLRDAAGEGPNGLALATGRLNKRWDELKRTFGESTAAEAEQGINAVADVVDAAIPLVERLEGRWTNLLSTLSLPIPIQALNLFRLFRGGGGTEEPTREPIGAASIASLQQWQRDQAANSLSDFEARYGGARNRRRGGGGRSGKSDAEREAERLIREADSARKAADRIIESNQDVTDDYARRAREAAEKIGLEGDALAAVERRHEIEAAVRRINTDLIEKEMDARRKAAAVAGEVFDEAGQLAEVTALFESQKAAIREHAESLADANREIAEFNLRQAQARVVIEATRTPMEAFNEDLETYIGLLREGAIDSDTFERQMDRMAERLADIRYEVDETAQAWAGFGDDVGQTLTDFIMNGGSAMDVLRELIRLPLERLLQTQVADPVADFIDGMTGNNRDQNVADARAGLPNSQRILGASVQVIDPAAQGAAASLTSVQTQGYGAAQALGAIQVSLGTELDMLALDTNQAAEAMGGLVPTTGQLGGAMQQVISMLSSGGGGGSNGFLGLAQLALGAFAGGGAAPNPALAESVSGAMAANPHLFASGTDQVPTGVPFWVGENGRELMQRMPSGNLKVYSNQEVRRGVDRNPGYIVNNTFNVPERANRRLTQSHVSRGVQMGIERAARKGLASGGSR